MKLNINNKYLEVIITNKDDQFRASCPTFPKCKGIGTTEDAAIEKLVKSISRFIGKSAEKTLATVFEASNYTEIVFDNTESKKEQKKIFNLDPGTSSSQKDINFKYDQPAELVDLYGKEPENDINQFLNLTAAQSIESKFANPQIMQSSTNKTPYEMPLENNPDNFMFGIMLSLN